MKDLVALAKPKLSAKFVRMETFLDPAMAPGQRQVWYPWPYVEGVTMEEATNDLAFLVTGAYGKPLAKQFGAPLRLALPWKYGFKSIKSIVRFEFTAERPKSFWEEIQSSEYGFWANVNPDVPTRAGARRASGCWAPRRRSRRCCSTAMASRSPISTRTWTRRISISDPPSDGAGKKTRVPFPEPGKKCIVARKGGGRPIR